MTVDDIVGAIRDGIAALGMVAHPVPMETGKFPELPPSKGSPKMHKIQEWLDQNPDKANLSNRQIAGLIGGVSHVLVGRARKHE